MEPSPALSPELLAWLLRLIGTALVGVTLWQLRRMIAVSDAMQKLVDEHEKKLAKHELTLYGVLGDNGHNGDLKALRSRTHDLAGDVQDEVRQRELLAKDVAHVAAAVDEVRHTIEVVQGTVNHVAATVQLIAAKQNIPTTPALGPAGLPVFP